MKEKHLIVLRFLVDNYDPIDRICFYGFKSIAVETGLEIKQVRRTCRFLARKGLTEFAKGLWNEDGEPIGSGYGATKLGVKYIGKVPVNRLSAA